MWALEWGRSETPVWLYLWNPAGPLYTDVPEAQMWCHYAPSPPLPPEPTVSPTFSDPDPDTVLILSPLIPLRIHPGLCYAFCHFSLGCFHSLCLRWPSHHLKSTLCVSYILCFVESAVSFRLDWDYMVLAGTPSNEMSLVCSWCISAGGASLGPVIADVNFGHSLSIRDVCQVSPL